MAYVNLVKCFLATVIAMSLNGFEGSFATGLGAMLFTRCVSGVRYEFLQLNAA